MPRQRIQAARSSVANRMVRRISRSLPTNPDRIRPAESRPGVALRPKWTLDKDPAGRRGSHVIAVSTGLFANGFVEVSGSEVRAGQTVRIPASP